MPRTPSGRPARPGLPIVLAILFVIAPAPAPASAWELPRIVVLPLVVVGDWGDPDDQIAAALGHSIETRLAGEGARPIRTDTRASTPEEIRALCERLGATAALATSATSAGGVSIDLTLHDGETGEPTWRGFAEGSTLAETRQKLPELLATAAHSAPTRYALSSPPPSAAAPSPNAPAHALDVTLPLPVEGLDVCDLDGDGDLEVVVTSEDALHVLDPPSAPLPGAIREAGFFDVFVAVDCADADGDGRPEIALTTRRHGGFRSHVLAMGNGEVRLLAEDLPYALRAVPAGTTRRLHAQRFPAPGRLYGPVHVLDPTGDGLEPGVALDRLPRDANLGALALLGEGSHATVDARGRLAVIAENGSLRRAPGLYGGFVPSWEVQGRTTSIGEEVLRVHLRDRIEVLPGPFPTLILTRTDAPLGNLFPNLTIGRDVELVALPLGTAGLEPVELPFGDPTVLADAEIADYRVVDWTGDGRLDLVVGLVTGSGSWVPFSDDPTTRLLVLPGRSD